MEKLENKIQGRIIIAMPETGGTGKNGNPWKKQEFVLETADNYPKKILFTLWGEKIEQYNLREGEQVTAFVDIESREYNGRWYTDLKAWKVDKSGAAAPAGNTDSPISGRVNMPPSTPEDALPF